jgi:hypothetical protein
MAEQVLCLLDLTTLLGRSDRGQKRKAGGQQHNGCKIAQQPPAHQP